MRRPTLIAIACVTLVAGGAVTWYLFRTVTYPAADQTPLWLDYSFGKPSRLRADQNHDGVVDWVAHVSIGRHGLETDELLVDADFDGQFDHRFVTGLPAAFVAQIDRDRDGTFETTIIGQEALDLYCQWAPCGPVY